MILFPSPENYPGSTISFHENEIYISKIRNLMITLTDLNPGSNRFIHQRPASAEDDIYKKRVNINSFNSIYLQPGARRVKAAFSAVLLARLNYI